MRYFAMLVTAIPLIPALYLFGRCILWHVPQLALMLWRSRPLPRGMVWHAPEPIGATEQDIYEVWLFTEVPSAFWLDPTRWERASWPAAPDIVRITNRSKARWDRKQGGV